MKTCYKCLLEKSDVDVSEFTHKPTQKKYCICNGCASLWMKLMLSTDRLLPKDLEEFLNTEHKDIKKVQEETTWKTFQEWSNEGYRIIKGSKSRNGKFSNLQVNKPTEHLVRRRQTYIDDDPEY